MTGLLVYHHGNDRAAFMAARVLFTDGMSGSIPSGIVSVAPFFNFLGPSTSPVGSSHLPYYHQHRTNTFIASGSGDDDSAPHANIGNTTNGGSNDDNNNNGNILCNPSHQTKRPNTTLSLSRLNVASSPSKAWLDEGIGFCKLDHLNFFYGHTNRYRTDAKDRVLNSTYLEHCSQLVHGTIDHVVAKFQEVANHFIQNH
uniref:DUF7086 domain-containing protein n=1 Tax=Oryza glumipatula TaxID=40148 RepID=A0A0D9ZYK2_9ORYZ